jgi:hypothetical protein
VTILKPDRYQGSIYRGGRGGSFSPKASSFPPKRKEKKEKKEREREGGREREGEEENRVFG